jgi:hypothetical protein
MSAKVSPLALPAPPAQLVDKFSDRVTKLLEKIDCRHADAPKEREAIFRLRYQAYLREGTILPNSSESFSDTYDDTDNVYLFGLYIDGQLASSIRIHVGSKEHAYFPSLDVFSDVLRPKLDAGKIIVDATRFVADEKLSKQYRALPYATVRLNWLAAGYFNNSYSIVAIRPEHQAFYRRTFGVEQICGSRPYPHLVKPICLMASNYCDVADEVHRRYPFFRSTFFERRMLFERGPLALAHRASQPMGNKRPFVDYDASRLAG